MKLRPYSGWNEDYQFYEVKNSKQKGQKSYGGSVKEMPRNLSPFDDRSIGSNSQKKTLKNIQKENGEHVRGIVRRLWETG